MQRRKSTSADEQIIRDKNADPVERASALFRLAVDGFFKFEPLAAEWLRHPSPFLRAEAVKVLVGFWRKSEYLEEAVQLLHFDPNEMVRGDAAFALSQFTFRTGERRETVVRELVKQLMQDDDFGVHEQCYRGLLQILAPEKSLTTLPTYFNREHNVDWELLRPYLDSSQML